MKKSFESKPFFIEIICALLFLVIVSGVLFSLYSNTLKSTISSKEINAGMIQMKGEAEKISNCENYEDMTKILGDETQSGVYEVGYNETYDFQNKNSKYKMITTVNPEEQNKNLYDVKIEFYKVSDDVNRRICGLETKKFFVENSL